MATDPDRHSDGRPTHRHRRLSKLPGGLHGAFQVVWALAIAALVVARVTALARHPTAVGALSVIEVTAIWALVASLTWGLRVLALTTSGRFGTGARDRCRRSGSRGIRP